MHSPISARELTERQQLAILYNPKTPSRYRNVYRKGDGWHAKVKRGGQLRALKGSQSKTAHDAALHVIRWYAMEFGPNWPDVFRARKCNPFEIRYSELFRGYFAVAFICGERVAVEHLARLPKRFGRNRWEPLPGQVAVFATRAEAKDNLRLYMKRRWGLLHRCALWRRAKVAEYARAA